MGREGDFLKEEGVGVGQRIYLEEAVPSYCGRPGWAEAIRFRRRTIEWARSDLSGRSACLVASGVRGVLVLQL